MCPSISNTAAVSLIGGTLLRLSMVALGAGTAEAFGRISADLLFLGVTGVHLEAGLTTGHSEEAALKSRLIRSAAETVVLATPDKIGATSPFQMRYSYVFVFAEKRA